VIDALLCSDTAMMRAADDEDEDKDDKDELGRCWDTVVPL